MSPPFDHQRNHFDNCIKGWLEDQPEQGQFELASALPSFIQRVMSDTPAQPWAAGPLDRPVSPSKRQRTLETNSSSQWVERISRPDGDSALSTFTEPTPSTTSASRAPSPTKSVRSRRVQLDYTNPAIFFGPPGQSYGSEEEMSDNSDSESQSAEQTAPTINQQVRKLSLEHAGITSSAVIDASIPPTISALIRRLSEEATDPVLPRDIISRISSALPTESFREPRAPEIPHSRTTRQFFRHVSKLFNMARELYAGSYDEAAWYPLIRMILIGPPGTNSSNPFVKHEEAHTRVVCSDLLPQQNGKPIPTVKVDHLLQFNPGHRLISPLYKPVFQSQPPSFSLSAFSDPVAAKTFTCAIIEVKAPGGNFQEASYQVAIASAAMLQRVRLLDKDASDGGDGGDYMPVVGWVVHGHFWTLHVSYREIDGSIRVLGPYPSGNTATYLGLYRLLRIVEEVKLWGKETLQVGYKERTSYEKFLYLLLSDYQTIKFGFEYIPPRKRNFPSS
ncbi:hypothetical protein G7Y89_g7402 [Cudoniella acicularis]|uniref:PD-(D/E)XK nuclease-like domain-containing protein n=1 Tax=Cudoniella acicularis TaxID=354080 RepID=A0A8H4RK68_9HELO|nr:hypothetical protein G7Y89_g7402 [Cudoniella acicularis]